MVVIHGPKYCTKLQLIHCQVQEMMIDNTFSKNEIRIRSSINCKQPEMVSVMKMVEYTIITAAFL